MKNEDIKSVEVGYKKTNFAYRFVLIILATVLCTVSLMAVTYGWFTADDDEFIHVSSGSVKIDVFQADADGNYISIKDGKGDIFGYNVWEPGQARFVFFKIKSESDIRVKYTMRIDALDEGLLEAFEYIAYRGEYFDTKSTTYEAIAGEHSPELLSNGLNMLSGDNYVYLEPGEEHYYVLGLHMLEEAGNTFQGQSFKLDLNVLAVQGNYSEIYNDSQDTETETETE